MGSSSDEEEVFLNFLILERRQCARSIFQNKETTNAYEMHMRDRESFLKYVTELQKTLLEGQYFFCYPLKASKNIVS